MQLLGCTSKTGQAGHRFEGPQRADSERALAWVIHAL
jgi:hypothetical protein